MEEKIYNVIKEHNIEKAYVLAYFYNQVCVGIYENNQITFNKDVNYNLLTQIRIFNKDLEIRFVLNEETNEYDISVIDDNIPNKGMFDEAMFIAGNKIVAENDKFTTIKQSGGEIDIPFKVTESDVRKGLRILVRNYFSTDKNNQVVIENSRLVDICKEEGEN